MPTEMILTHGDSSATLSSLGAELMSWRTAGREWIWNGDARWWPRRSPTLFPFNGWLNGGQFRAKGTVYPTGVHGFGRDTDFTLERIDAATAVMRLTDTPETRAQFPYAFALSVTARLDADGLDFAFEVANPGAETLPFSLGFHPGYVWPFDGGDPDAYEVIFEKDETFDIPKIAPGGLFTSEQLPGVPVAGGRMRPATALTLQESLCFRNAASRRVDFVAPSGRRLEIRLDGFPNWVIWRKPGGAYLCIEGWSGLGDPVGFADEIVAKPGMTLLPPGETRGYRYSVRLV